MAADKYEINSLFDDDETIDSLEDKTVESRYSMKVNIPQYEPKNVKPTINALCDTTKYKELLENIEKSDVPENEKNFLRLAATRHIVFNYSLIADYYAHSDAKVQKLMEDSALVIIDINDAIANGYVELNERLREIMKQSENYNKKAEKYGIEA